MKTEKPLEALNDFQIYTRLFFITFSLSACTFGGGFVIIGMMRQRFVEQLGWLTEEEMLDMTAIAQSSPGALAVNIAVVTGYRLKGVAGAALCTLGAVLPPLFIISLISVFYRQFRENPWIATALRVMRAGVAAVIFHVVLDLAQGIRKTKSPLWIAVMAAAFLASCFFGVSAVVLILCCGLVGFLWAALSKRREIR